MLNFKRLPQDIVVALSILQTRLFAVFVKLFLFYSLNNKYFFLLLLINEHFFSLKINFYNWSLE